MADKGTVGVRFEGLSGPQTVLVFVSPYWRTGTQVGTRFEGRVGPQIVLGGRTVVTVPPDLVPIIVGAEGGGGGGISVW